MKLTFTLFSDFHYCEGGYIASIADLNAILDRADASDSDFILSAGDLCNHMIASPELLKTLHHHRKPDGTILPAYNVYGNHELEGAGNSMEVVTPTLTNDPDVIWGTPDGKMDANIGYYYFEKNGFRIVALDSQYSYNSTLGEWEHSQTASWGPPAGNSPTNALGPVQLAWLEEVLTDAAGKELPCIVVAHDGFSGLFANSSSDAATVRSIFKKVNDRKAGTVRMCINGHIHTNHQGYNEGVFYLDMNTTRNNWWQAKPVDHYTDEMTYPREWYDEEGNLIRITEEPIASLGMGRHTWFSADPISTVVTIDENGTIHLDGTESDWIYGVLPPDDIWDGIECRSSSGVF